MDFYFKNIRLIDPNTNRDEHINVRILDGVFKHISSDDCSKITQTTKVIDGQNLVMSPGFIDIHVHLREPGQEHKETLQTGTDSAANGGFTALVCMPNTKPSIDSVEIIEFIKNRTSDLLTDVFISAAITKGRKGETISDFVALKDAGAVLFTDDGDPVSNSNVMKEAFEIALPNDIILSQHCEDAKLTGNFTMNESELSDKLGLKGYPYIAEDIILYRDIRMAEYYGNCSYHAQHLSTAGAVDLVRDAKSRGLRVTCEVTPHHFVLTEDNMKTYNSNYKMNPPLRKQADVDAIIEGIKDGTVDCIATDHAPHSIDEKSKSLDSAPNGIVGLETAFGLSMTYLVHKGHISLNKLVDLLTFSPRKLLKLRQPIINEGEVANVTIFDPVEEWTVNNKTFRSKSSNTPFNDFKLSGKPKFTFNKNKFVECNL